MDPTHVLFFFDMCVFLKIVIVLKGQTHKTPFMKSKKPICYGFFSFVEPILHIDILCYKYISLKIIIVNLSFNHFIHIQSICSLIFQALFFALQPLNFFFQTFFFFFPSTFKLFFQTFFVALS